MGESLSIKEAHVWTASISAGTKNALRVVRRKRVSNRSTSPFFSGEDNPASNKADAFLP
jgi:hypothetical protein